MTFVTYCHRNGTDTIAASSSSLDFSAYPMPHQGFVLAASAGITAAIQLSGFIAAYVLQTEVFYDVMGGLNYIALAAFSVLYPDGTASDHVRSTSATILFVLSRGWLLLFLGWRAHERGGDARFDGVIEKAGLFLVYWTVQAFWVYLVSLPVIFINGSSARPGDFTALDIIAQAGWALGIFMEVLADIQKAIWVKRGRAGHFCSVGIWRYSRHPNYFGELLQWWSAWILAFSSSEAAGANSGLSDPLWWLCVLSPLFTTNILLNQRGTGLVDAEGMGLKRYYDKCPTEYAEYRKNTSILVPMVGYGCIPLWLKRTLFLDFKRYEYGQGSQVSKEGSQSEGQSYCDQCPSASIYANAPL
mmetsp:Transcript_52052/g.156199  ORF Transcript_52052/g.156199 Transcript_52052/m.156199 type:complete len:358 (-) Transcript_52052:201-1274(-)